MPYTFPNQRKIVIHKEYPKSDFLQIKNEHWTYINKKYSPYGLQLYLYLAKNKDGFELALSPEAAEQEAGIKKTTFHKYLNIFIADGYLVERNGNTYDFTKHRINKRKGVCRTSKAAVRIRNREIRRADSEVPQTK